MHSAPYSVLKIIQTQIIKILIMISPQNILVSISICDTYTVLDTAHNIHVYPKLKKVRDRLGTKLVLRVINVLKVFTSDRSIRNSDTEKSCCIMSCKRCGGVKLLETDFRDPQLSNCEVNSGNRLILLVAFCPLFLSLHTWIISFEIGVFSFATLWWAVCRFSMTRMFFFFLPMNIVSSMWKLTRFMWTVFIIPLSLSVVCWILFLCKSPTSLRIPILPTEKNNKYNSC